MGYVSATDRREQLVAAAVRVLRRDGVAAATTRRIAEEAGAPLASIHYTFGGKDEVVSAAIAEVIDELVARLRVGLDPAAGVAAAVRHTCRRLVDVLDTDPALDRLLTDLTAAGGAVSRAQYERFLVATETMLDEVLAASGEEIAVEVAQLARLLVAGIDGLGMQWELMADPETTADDLDRMADALVGLAAPRRRRRRTSR